MGLCVYRQESSPVGTGAGINAPQQGTGGEQGAEGLAQGLQREGPTRHGTTALKFPSAQTSAQPKHLMAAVI